MLTPIVTEISRVAEPVVRDTFIREFDPLKQREQGASATVVRLASHRLRRRRPLAVPARAA
ncbi:MAG TPA: hypothetical protein VGV67_09085 [Solirubrobacteraceae bacterium]|nr:hypothetical protein [Solirubrobacteraceae bacterium]